jgi:hypothetical protein
MKLRIVDSHENIIEEDNLTFDKTDILLIEIQENVDAETLRKISEAIRGGLRSGLLCYNSNLIKIKVLKNESGNSDNE